MGVVRKSEYPKTPSVTWLLDELRRGGDAKAAYDLAALRPAYEARVFFAARLLRQEGCRAGPDRRLDHGQASDSGRRATGLA